MVLPARPPGRGGTRVQNSATFLARRTTGTSQQVYCVLRLFGQDMSFISLCLLANRIPWPGGDSDIYIPVGIQGYAGADLWDHGEK